MAAGAAAAGGLDLFDHGLVEQGLHHFGLAESPSLRLPSASTVEHTGTLASRFMRRPLGWTITVPAGAPAPTGVVICLHGKGGSHRTAFDDVHVPDAAAFVGLRVAVAGVDGGADSYWHRRADGTDAMSMLLEEFLPVVDHVVGRRPRALMGWSMGGYGALLAAETARSEFVAVAPASPAMWLTPGETAPGAFDSAADFYAHDALTGASALAGLAVAVACGTGDPFYHVTWELVARMSYPHTAIFGPGFHDSAYWSSVAPDQLRAIGSVL